MINVSFDICLYRWSQTLEGRKDWTDFCIYIKMNVGVVCLTNIIYQIPQDINDVEDTEFNAILRQKGILPALPKKKEETPPPSPETQRMN